MCPVLRRRYLLTGKEPGCLALPSDSVFITVDLVFYLTGRFRRTVEQGSSKQQFAYCTELYLTGCFSLSIGRFVELFWTGLLVGILEMVFR